METDTCYVYDSTDTIYAFPLLTCTSGGSLPSFDSTTREKYYITRGKLFKVSSDIVTSADLSNTSYITYIFRGESFLDYNTLILPSVLFILCFFVVIYKWFFRLRG